MPNTCAAAKDDRLNRGSELNGCVDALCSTVTWDANTGRSKVWRRGAPVSRSSTKSWTVLAARDSARRRSAGPDDLKPPHALGLVHAGCQFGAVPLRRSDCARRSDSAALGPSASSNQCR